MTKPGPEKVYDTVVIVAVEKEKKAKFKEIAEKQGKKISDLFREWLDLLIEKRETGE